MAVENVSIGQTANPAALADAIKLFATANGWTLAFDNGNSGYCLSKSGVYTRVTWNNGTSRTNATLTLTGAAGVSGGAITDASAAATTNNLIGPFVQHWLYAGTGDSGPYIHGVVEYRANVFAHFGFGRIDKRGSFDGGEYVYRTAIGGGLSTASSQAYPFWTCPTSVGGAPTGESSVRVAVNGTQRWLDDRQGGSGNARMLLAALPGFALGPLSTLVFGTNAFNGVSPFWPPVIVGIRPDSTSNRAFYGTPPDMRCCSGAQFAPRQTITLGNDTWRLFPWVGKNDATVVNTDNRFFAYLES